MSCPPKIPRAAVVALLSGKGKRGMTQQEIGMVFGVTGYSAGVVVRALAADGEAYSYRYGNQVFFVLCAAEPIPEPAAPPPLATPPFKFDAWTRPLQGYNLFAHRDLAMAARS